MISWSLYHNSEKLLDLGAKNLVSLEGFPDWFLNLEFLDLRENFLENLEGLPRFFPNIKAIYLENNPLRGLHGISETTVIPVIEGILKSHNTVNFFNFTQRGHVLIMNSISWADPECKTARFSIPILNSLRDYYKKSPFELASALVSGKNLSEEEQERLKHEGGKQERQLLEMSETTDKEMIEAITSNLTTRIRSGFELHK
jgi:hypothetical protein